MGGKGRNWAGVYPLILQKSIDNSGAGGAKESGQKKKKKGKKRGGKSVPSKHK